MARTIIRSTLDLLLTLMDATTGFAVDERNIRFLRDGEMLTATSKGEGCYVFINAGRENCLMKVDVYGFEPVTLEVDYEKLDKVLPSIDVFLIPSENTGKGEPLLTMKGKLSGLERIEAVHPGRPVTTFRELDVKKHIMTIFTPNRRANLTDSRYGLLGAERETFEIIEIEEEITPKKIRLRKNPDGEVSPNSLICRVLYGQVEKDGTYLFRIRNDGRNLTYLIKYVVNGETRYKKVDFADGAVHSLD